MSGRVGYAPEGLMRAEEHRSAPDPRELQGCAVTADQRPESARTAGWRYARSLLRMPPVRPAHASHPRRTSSPEADPRTVLERRAHATTPRPDSRGSATPAKL